MYILIFYAAVEINVPKFHYTYHKFQKAWVFGNSPMSSPGDQVLQIFAITREHKYPCLKHFMNPQFQCGWI